MTVVVDAGILAAMVLPLPYSDAARSRMGNWADSGETVLAPFLLAYEVTSTFREAVAQKWLTTGSAADALDYVLSAGIRLVEPSSALNRRALEWSERLGQRATYDSAYVALAESERVELWTTDGRLAKAGQRLGIEWIRSVLA